MSSVITEIFENDKVLARRRRRCRRRRRRLCQGNDNTATFSSKTAKLITYQINEVVPGVGGDGGVSAPLLPENNAQISLNLP